MEQPQWIVVKLHPEADTAYVAQLQPDGSYLATANGLIPLRTAEAFVSGAMEERP